jgi:hypothetical protein
MKKRLSKFGVGMATIGMALFAASGSGHATSCPIPREGFELELVSVTRGGELQDISSYPASTAELHGGNRVATFRLEPNWQNSFTTSTLCGGFIAVEDLQPDVPAQGDDCSHQGLHCHWPESGELCAARCDNAQWQVSGCE